MSLEHEIEGKLKETFKDSILETKIPREHRIFVNVTLGKVKEVISYLKENYGFTHITTITAIDTGEDIEVIYHLFSQGVSFNLRTFTPKANPVIDTITDILPGAVLYEREIQDLLGLQVKGHPDPRRLVLPDDWPEGVYPLRKEYSTKEG
ncbi:NADH-quinone oxidoreductase subunit C [Chloroflexota bacterium]